MPHDKIKDPARKRMAETGEPYTLARRMVIEEHARLKARQDAELPAVALEPDTLPNHPLRAEDCEALLPKEIG
jgi:hypothetical protein